MLGSQGFSGSSLLGAEFGANFVLLGVEEGGEGVLVVSLAIECIILFSSSLVPCEVYPTALNTVNKNVQLSD